MKFKYSKKIEDESRIAKGSGIGLNMSFKHSVAVCDKIRHMMLTDAMAFLESVINLERPTPFKRFRKGIGHRKGKETIGKYPKKASSEILKVLRNIEANADYKGLDPQKMKMVHIQAQKGITRRRIRPKGRWHLWRQELINIQAIAKER